MFRTLMIEDSADAAEKLRFLLSKYCADKIDLLAHAASCVVQATACTPSWSWPAAAR